MDLLIFQAPILLVQASMDGILLGILFALIAYGMALQWGVMNIINIAQGDLVILGGYIAYFMYLYGIHPAWGVIVSPIIMYFVGIGIYKLVINKVVDRDLFISILATFGISILFMQLMNFAFGADVVLANSGYGTTMLFDNSVVLPNSKIIYLHAKEIIQRLGDGTIDVGISGLDLLQESSMNLQKKIEIKKKLDFGVADVVVAIPNDWIDVQTVADLEEVSFDFRDKKNTRLRVATKYPNLTNNFLVSKGITQYKLVPSLGATETYPFIGSSEIITDITSTGKTLKDNNLRVLKDGCILNSQACLLISKKKAATLRPFLNPLI